MTGRFAAFTFVDRITHYEPGRSARGTFHVPEHVTAFPQSLLAEAAGQLAAWVAMAGLDYRLRPVAGIAHQTRYAGIARPGDLLETGVRIDSCAEDAVAYQGWARVGGRTLMELVDCVGPMLPMEDFDDPLAVQDFMQRLLGEGADPDRFGSVATLPLEAVEREAGVSARAMLRVPEQAAFFADHFPRRPVFPGTLLLDRMIELAAVAAREARPGAALEVREVSDVKLRAFTEPGSVLELQATLEAGSDTIEAALTARAPGQKRPVGGARVHFGATA